MNAIELHIGPCTSLLRPQRTVIAIYCDLEYRDHFNTNSAQSRKKFLKEMARRFDIPLSETEHLDAEIARKADEADQRVEDEARRSDDAPRGGHEEEDSELPVVHLPGGEVPVTTAAIEFGKLLAASDKWFNRGGAAVTLANDDVNNPKLREVHAAALPSAFETVATLRKLHGTVAKPSTCSERTARSILFAEPFLSALPPIRVLTRCPVLIERNGELVQITGYDRESGILAGGQEAPEILLDDARGLLNELVAGFRFATAGDRSRALAAILTPALVFGGLLGGRAAVDLGEADQSQSGKGYRNKITGAVYGHKVNAVTQRKQGVGGLEESFNAALIRGAAFISLDNVRGRIDSPTIESFLTEDTFIARASYSKNVEIDPRRVVVMMTSNKAEVKKDLANRSSLVRILKQPEGYEFTEFLEGDLLAHVRANRAQYLGAVFAIVREWHHKGKCRTDECRHDFGPWARILDWIVQEILAEAPVMQGHPEAKLRMTNPALTGLRDIALAVDHAGRLEEPMRAHHILDILADTPGAETPGVDVDSDLEDKDTRDKALRAIGRLLGKCFRDQDEVEIDAFLVERSQTKDFSGRDVKEYTFISTLKKFSNVMYLCFLRGGYK